jgi:hypothetical protein
MDRTVRDIQHHLARTLGTELSHETIRVLTALPPRTSTTPRSSPPAGFVASGGLIEGAARWLIKDRMEVTGARWGLDSAEAVLRLRPRPARKQRPR